MIKQITVIALVVLVMQSAGAVLSQKVFAACSATNSNQSAIGVDIFDGTPQFGCEGDNSNIIQRILSAVFGVMAVVSVLFVAIGGLRYAFSGGDPNAIASAKKTILYSLVGLALGLSVFTITNFIFNQVIKV